jgi:hypothetical protein
LANPPNCLRHRYFRTAIAAAATSNHQEATIHLHHLTLDEARSVGTEKYSDIGNLFACPRRFTGVADTTASRTCWVENFL